MVIVSTSFPETKRCTKCKKVKEAKHFGVRTETYINVTGEKRIYQYLYSNCKDCRCIKQNIYNSKHNRRLKDKLTAY